MKISRILPVIGIIIFIYIIVDIGIEKIVDSFFSIPLIFILVASVFILPRVFLGSLKWWYICRKQNMDVSLVYIIRIFLISLFYGIITPASIGSMMSIYYIKEKTGESWEKCITNSLLDVASEFIILLFLALIGSIFIFEFYPGVFYTLLVIFIIFIVVFFVLMKKQQGSWLFRIVLQPLLPDKIKSLVDNSLESLYEDIPTLSDMIFPFAIGLLLWILNGVQVYIIAQAFSINIPYHVFIFIFIISVLAGLLPVSIGGLGIREGAFVALLLIFGVQPEVTFVISLSSFFLSTMIPGIAGGILSITSKQQKKVRNNHFITDK